MNLPIDDIIPNLKSALAKRLTVILQAPPGAGKTTRVPLALLDETWLKGQKILMLEPRRLAAGNAARYMAEQCGEKVGETVGYSIRYQRQVSRQTKIEVVTEGILTRRLQSDPELNGIGLVIFDEFHERNLNSDLALALCRDAQQGLREDLKILVMSATLDGEPLAQLLDAPLLTSEGRSYPVNVHYSGRQNGNPVESTAAAVRKALRETEGDILAFLPGAGEIERCRQALSGLTTVDVRPLYGTLSYSEQEKAIRSGPNRKIVLATNIAETSLTIDGIRTVIDSGYARQPRFDPGRGLTRLEKVRISRASADQRAGRAGRLGPGSCYRLWSEGEQGGLLPFTPPEIRNADLAPLALDLANWGISDPHALTWLDPPPEGGLSAARKLLQMLDALDDTNLLTPLGKQMAALPAHPRIARLLLFAKAKGCLSLGCDLAALLSEPLSLKSERKASIDLTDQIERLWNLRRHGELREFKAVERASAYWRNFFKIGSSVHPPHNIKEISLLLACAFPDRIGKQRGKGMNSYLFASGQGGNLPDKSNLQSAAFLVATEMAGKRFDESEIRLACPLRQSDIFQLYPELPRTRSVEWDPQEGRVNAREVQLLGKLAITEKRIKPTKEETANALKEAIVSEGTALLNWTREAKSLIQRVAILTKSHPDECWPDLSEAHLIDSIDDWLMPFLGDSKNRNDLKRIDLLPALRTLFNWTKQQRLEKLAPERLQVASGSNIRIKYEDDGPVLAVKLQEMFGEADTPRIAEGRIALKLHLLSPAGRPLQVTQDLKTFWNDVYPEVRKEMKGRYPKHPWPEDPWNAVPTRHTKKRKA